jgi:hypothetical protein
MTVSDPADKPGEMTPAPGADLPEGPDTDVFVVRAASAPERQIHSNRGVPASFRFLATTVETAGRYSFLAWISRSAEGRGRMSIGEQMSGSTLCRAIPSSTSMTARSLSPRATSCTFPWAPPIGSRYSMRRSRCSPDTVQQARSSPSCRTGRTPAQFFVLLRLGESKTWQTIVPYESNRTRRQR